MVDRISTWRSNSHKRNVVIVLFGFHLCVSLLFGGMMSTLLLIVLVYIAIGMICTFVLCDCMKQEYQEYLKYIGRASMPMTKFYFFINVVFSILIWPLTVIEMLID
jgi:hypothetical protein